MSTLSLRFAFFAVAFISVPRLPLYADPEKPGAEAAQAAPATDLNGWGELVDPAKDCIFKLVEDNLVIVVPGSDRSHDLSAELSNVDAPRVLQSIKGDFTIEVQVDGLFSPGGESTQPGRTGYTGAGIVIMADDDNYVRLERAALQHSGSDQSFPYINFEVRLNGQLVQIGSTGDHKTPTEKPVWLRLARQGTEFHAAVKQEGEEWAAMAPKTLPSAWPDTLKAGVHAVSTSKQVFSPKFSGINVKRITTQTK
jgi:regulation of enolase protein 1 (concanavalin A-like superfamily)